MNADPASDSGIRASRWRWLWLTVPVLIAVGAVASRWPDRADPDPEPIDLVASGPVLETAADLIAAGDLIVVATVVSIEEGRVITDPNDPTAGIRTSLLALQVDETLRGSTVDRLIVEHETALLDGTPITVDGIGPPGLGQPAVFVLIDGPSPSFPHHGLVAPTGWAPIVDDRLGAAAGAGDDHPLTGLPLATFRELTTS